MSFNLGFIGGGNMSTAIFKGILNKDGHPPSKIWVSGPHLDNLKHWQALGANVTTKNGEVFAKCTYIFLGVKPTMLETSVQDSYESLPAQINCQNVVVMSMLAGVTLEKLQKVFQLFKFPICITAVRIMPNVSMAIGSGSCLLASEGVGDDQKNVMTKLLRCCGACEEVPESLINNLGVLTACGPAYIFIVIEALADGAVKQGVPRHLALRFAAQTVMGSAHLVLESGKHPAQLKDEVCSPGGTTICGISALEDAKVRSAFINAIEASVNKTKSMESHPVIKQQETKKDN